MLNKYLKQDDDLEELISKDKVILHFYSPFNGPCKKINNILDKRKDIIIIKINVEEFSSIIYRYNIKSIPTLILFKNNSLVDKLIGFKSEEDIINFINQ